MTHATVQAGHPSASLPQTTFGCPADCGPNGRCTSAPDGTAACACECGWAGAACDVPSGFCSSFPAELSGAAVCPVSPTPAPVPSPEAAPCRPLQGGAGACLYMVGCEWAQTKQTVCSLCVEACMVRVGWQVQAFARACPLTAASATAPLAQHHAHHHPPRRLLHNSAV